MNSQHFVYILRCKDNTYYTGYTTCLKRRLDEHLNGIAAKYTRGRLPVTLVYSESVENKSQGLKREREIKKLSRKHKDLLIKEGGNNFYTEKLSKQ